MGVSLLLLYLSGLERVTCPGQGKNLTTNRLFRNMCKVRGVMLHTYYILKILYKEGEEGENVTSVLRYLGISYISI